ncbi:hypothetical protein [Amycolatopsis rubida]|uniref:YobI-like P-loop NTPase domain-containing protein n=1 Tax=Amycolatopsis rubida TaxID=112413 RepID=A0A1I5E6M8_9PSEU|nr:hypothetical protein [Amycolatopsis rubida]SFO06761.1 hypothetical protein SAMN05421854_101508 [Amycolatopsis rubida]
MSDAEHGPGCRKEKLVASADETEEPVEASRKAPLSNASGRSSLTSLAPQYDEDQHKIYLDQLEAAVNDQKNRNIALSGPYGTGKSSVLDKFQENHKDSILRLAVSTLSPETQDSTLTNRIQKEVLKQLVYSARPRTLRHSRFSRRGPLPRWRAFGESALFVSVVGGLLALFGRLPPQIATSANHTAVVQALVWLGIFGLLVVVFAALRLVTYDRFVLSNVSAAGATLALSAQNHTYFDEYLDEIVYFFDQEPKDIVLFEDLDRYNDPQIFQALRELNTLLNSTPKRLRKIEKREKPLRFVYAVRDSLFEKLGEDTAAEGDDAARAETVRANRTKFFEFVIPVVPFISHRTAREHLYRLLREKNIYVQRALIETVARHATDMRLLVNISNEYLVFADRLLNIGRGRRAPDLSPSHLFALVAYKNFHLKDFENIARGSSLLDRLYDFHRNLVATSVAAREKRKRDLLAKDAQARALGLFAERLGGLLNAIAKIETPQNQSLASRPKHFVIGSARYDEHAVTTPAFWEAVIASPTIAVQAEQTPGYNNWVLYLTLTQKHLEDLFPDVLKGRWEKKSDKARHEELPKIDREIEELRSADFQDLVADGRFTLEITTPQADTVDAADDVSENLTFGALVDKILTSELARDLVRQGYIDRNFTLYAAQFYGDFTGVDVATFIVQIVQRNTLDINFQFTSSGALANLLAEAGEDFTRTISAYNIQLVDYFLDEDLERADEVVTHLTSNFGEDAATFLSAFFTTDPEGSRLAARLSHAQWKDVFVYLVTNEGVPDDRRAVLVDAALAHANPDGDYNLTAAVSDFVVSHYTEMPAFTQLHPKPVLDTVVLILQRAEISLPNLYGVHDELKTLLVDNNMYDLTAENLRAAVDLDGQVTLDEICGNHTVYQYCLANLVAYLDAVEADAATDYSTQAPETLVDALHALADETGQAVAEPDYWPVSGYDLVERLTATASPESVLRHLADAPKSTWKALASAKLFRASLANLDTYRAEIGGIDESLGQLLLDAGAIHADEGETPEPSDGDNDAKAERRAAAAVAILNARRGIRQPEDRVRLVVSLGIDTQFSAADVASENSNLFALLIEHDLVPDDAVTFAHLRSAGWTALRAAVLASKGVEDFLAPGLVDGMLVDLFEDPETSAKVGRLVLGGLASFLPVDDHEALDAAARFAVLSGAELPVDQIRRVATTVNEPNLTIRLLQIAAPDAGAVTSVLNELGGNYSYLTTWERDEFEVPSDQAHRDVFKILSDAGVCRTRQRPRKEMLAVRRPVTTA